MSLSSGKRKVTATLRNVDLLERQTVLPKSSYIVHKNKLGCLHSTFNRSIIESDPWALYSPNLFLFV